MPPDGSYADYRLESFTRALDQMRYIDCLTPIENFVQDRSIESKYLTALRIVALRAIQASPYIEEQQKAIARAESRQCFDVIREEIRGQSDSLSRLNLLAILVYLKPEQPDTPAALVACSEEFEKHELTTELSGLLQYCKSFLSYRPWARTPREHYQFGKSIQLDSRNYIVRVCDVKLRTRDTDGGTILADHSSKSLSPVSVLIGCSTVDTVAFHKDRCYDVTVSVPGISLAVFSRRFLDDLLCHITSCLAIDTSQIQPDFVLGYGDVTRLFNSDVGEVIDEYPELIDRTLRIVADSKVNIAFQPSFSPVNQRLLQYPSVFGVFPRNPQSQTNLMELIRLIKSNLASKNSRPVFQRVFCGDNPWIDPRYLIHPHEIHVRLDSSLSEYIQLEQL